MNNLYHKVAVASIGIALILALHSCGMLSANN